MTTGTSTSGTGMAATQRYLFQKWVGGQSGPSPSGTPVTGLLRTKTWSGLDTPTPKKTDNLVNYSVRSQFVAELNDKPIKLDPGYVTPVTYTQGLSWDIKIPVRRGKRKYGPRKKDVKRAPNPYTMTINTEYAPQGSFQVDMFNATTGAWVSMSRYTGCSAVGWGLVTTLPALPSWTANDDIKLIGKLREKLVGSDFNAAVFLGEANQSLRLIGDTAIRLATAYSAFRKGDVAKAARVLAAGAKYKPRNKRSVAGSNWLELQYGWLPLLSDMKEGAEALSHQLHQPFSQQYRVRRRLRNEDRYANGSYVEWEDKFAIYSKQIIANISEPPSTAVLSGLLDPELVAWELTPFSFVADWVMPIGDYLSARAFAGHLVGEFITTTITRQRISGLVPKGYTNGSNQRYVAVVNDGGYLKEKVTMNRSISSALAVPKPSIKPLAKAASWQHCVNGIALLTGVVMGVPGTGRGIYK